MKSDELDHQDFLQFALFLERQCGIVLNENKSYLVRSRLMPLVRRENLDSLSDLIKTVLTKRNNSLCERVVDAMTTNETLWFRDKYPFDILSNTLFDQLNQKRRKVRIWSAACSSGQEPYSIAMLVQEYKKQNPAAFRSGIEIVSTDISAEMLERAKQAKYDALSIGRGLSEERKQRFFKPVENNLLQLSPQVTSMVSFRLLNLLESYSGLGQFDVIFCRNVLIYFSASNKRKILQQIAACLQNDGALMLGASESIADSADKFTLVRNNPGLYYAKKAI